VKYYIHTAPNAAPNAAPPVRLAAAELKNWLSRACPDAKFGQTKSP